MDTLRTPEERFADLEGFDCEPSHVEVPDGDGGSLRIGFVDAGTGPVVLLLHGEPTWSYLYRTMIPPLSEAGLRCVAPDLVGFGRSDKPARQGDYSYARMVEWTRAALFDELDLRDVTFFGQDWGGLIGLRLVAEHPDRFARVVISNTGLTTGDQRMPDAFLRWRAFAARSTDFDVGTIVDGGSLRALTPGEMAAYRAPFPDERFMAGARVLPSLVPATPDDPAAEDNRRAWTSLTRFDKPFLCTFSDSDPITAGANAHFEKVIPGARGQSHTTIEGAGHFVQEDAGSELAALIARFAGR